jgi:hypothetical protein
MSTKWELLWAKDDQPGNSEYTSPSPISIRKRQVISSKPLFFKDSSSVQSPTNCFNDSPETKLSRDREKQFLKHFSPIASTLFGIENDLSE